MIDLHELEMLKNDNGSTYGAFVKGWVDVTADDVMMLADELGFPDKPTAVKWTHTYAAKLQTAQSIEEGWSWEFREYDGPGRGRFKCTTFEEDKSA
jgi:hypothetical protein